MDDTALLFTELGVLFVGMSLLSLLAHFLRLPAIPFYLVAGLAFGDGGFWQLDAAIPFVSVGAELGILLLLLVLGLEFSADELMTSLRRQRRSGVVDFVLNAPPGAIAGYALGLPWQACLALAGVTWVSSSGIAARVLDDLGRLGNRETPAVLSVLVLEDIAMAVYLPLLAVVLVGGGAESAIAGVVVGLGLVLAVLLTVSRAGNRIGRLLTHPSDEQLLLRLLGLMLVVAGLAQGAGISAAVGAFLVGIAIPAEMADRARGLLLPLRNIFAAVFFVGFGLSTDPGELVPVLPLALVLAAVSVLTKLGTGWYAAGRDGTRNHAKLRAGNALVARGEFSIVIAGLAAAAGYLEVAQVAAAYVLLLAVAGPLLARYSDQLALLLRLSNLPPPKAA